MKSLAPALASLLAAFCALAANPVAALERQGLELGAFRAASRGDNPAVLALLESAEQALRDGQPEQAATFLERALRIEPRNAVAWHYLAVARLDLGNFGQAEAMAAKSHGLAAGDRALRTRNAGLMADAQRASGKPVAVPNDESPAFASRRSSTTSIESAGAYAGAGNPYQRADRTEERRRRPSAEPAPQTGLDAQWPAWRAQRESAERAWRAQRESAERAWQARTARRGECRVFSDRGTTIVTCDETSRRVPASTRPVARVDRRYHRRSESNEAAAQQR
jgi:tetratricopeptide (TPR) repeat protein